MDTTRGLMRTNFGHNRALPFDDSLKISSCRRRPEDGKPCPLMGHSKNNSVCSRCALVGDGSGEILSPLKIQDLLDCQKILFFRDPTEREKAGIKCDTPWCKNPAEKILYQYVVCNACRPRLDYRIRTHKQKYGRLSFPPEHELFAPLQQGAKLPLSENKTAKSHKPVNEKAASIIRRILAASPEGVSVGTLAQTTSLRPEQIKNLLALMKIKGQAIEYEKGLFGPKKTRKTQAGGEQCVKAI